MARDTIDCGGRGQEPCLLDPLKAEVDEPCPGFGDYWDNDEGECVCRRGLERDAETDNCEFTGIPPIGDPVTSVSWGGEGNLGGGDDDDNDDDENDDEEGEKLRIELKCSTWAPRGDRADCAVTPQNAHGDVTYRWRFAPSPERVPIRTGVEGPLLEPLEALGMDSTWKGKAAAGGKVSVMAEDSTRFAHAHVRFEVDDGGYTTPVGLEEGDRITDYLWGDGGKILGERVGRNANGPTVGSSYGALDIIMDRAGVHVVEAGPNRGYAIVRYDRYSAVRYRQINERLDSTGPKEIPYGDTLARHWDYLKAKGYDPSRFLDGVMAHEGYGRIGRKGHQGQIEKALTVEACGDAGAIAARIVAPTAQVAEELMEQTEAIADTAFLMAALHDHVYGNMGASGAVGVAWAPNESPKIFVHYDEMADTSYNFSSPGCDWSSF